MPIRTSAGFVPHGKVERLKASSLEHMIYASVATQDFVGAPQLTELLNKARVANEGVGLTGMLLHSDSDGSFFQVLEGEPCSHRSTVAKASAGQAPFPPDHHHPGTHRRAGLHGLEHGVRQRLAGKAERSPGSTTFSKKAPASLSLIPAGRRSFLQRLRKAVGGRGTLVQDGQQPEHRFAAPPIRALPSLFSPSSIQPRAKSSPTRRSSGGLAVNLPIKCCGRYRRTGCLHLTRAPAFMRSISP